MTNLGADWWKWLLAVYLWHIVYGLTSGCSTNPSRCLRPRGHLRLRRLRPLQPLRPERTGAIPSRLEYRSRPARVCSGHINETEGEGERTVRAAHPR